MRRTIKKLVNEDKEKALFSNVVRYLLEYNKDDKKDDDEEIEKKFDGTNQITIEEIQEVNKELSQKMDEELIEYMKKEIRSLKLIDNKVEEFELINLKEFDIMSMKENVAYICESMNLNSFQFCSIIDNISQLFEKIFIIKCGCDDCYTERVVVLGSKRNEKQSVNEKRVYNVMERLINFLYGVYANAIFILKSSDKDYKKITERAVKLMNTVKMF